MAAILLDKKILKIDNFGNEYHDVVTDCDEAIFFNVYNNSESTGPVRNSADLYLITHAKINSLYVFCNTKDLDFFFESVYAPFVDNKVYAMTEEEGVRRRALQETPSTLESSTKYITAHVFNQLWVSYSCGSFIQYLDDCPEDFYRSGYVIRFVCDDNVKFKLINYLKSNMLVNYSFFYFVPQTLERAFLYDKIFNINDENCKVFERYRLIERASDPKNLLDNYSPISLLTFKKIGLKYIVKSLVYYSVEQCMEFFKGLPISHYHYLLEGGNSKKIAAILVTVYFQFKCYRVIIYNKTAIPMTLSGSEKMLVRPVESEREVLSTFLKLFCKRGSFPTSVVIQSDFMSINNDILIRICRYMDLLLFFYDITLPLEPIQYVTQNVIPLKMDYEISLANAKTYPLYQINAKLTEPLEDADQVPTKSQIKPSEQKFFERTVRIISNDAYMKNIFDAIEKYYLKNDNTELFLKSIVMAKTLSCSVFDIYHFKPYQISEILLETLYLKNGCVLKNCRDVYISNIDGVSLFNDAINEGGVKSCTWSIKRDFCSYMDFRSFYPSILYAHDIDLNNVTITRGDNLKSILGKYPAISQLDNEVYHFYSFRRVDIAEVQDDSLYLMKLHPKAFDNLKRPMLRDLFKQYLFDPISKNAFKGLLNGLIGCLNSKNFKYYSPYVYSAMTFFSRRILLFLLDNMAHFYEIFINKTADVDFKEMYDEWFTNDINKICDVNTINVDGFLITCCRNEREIEAFTAFLNESILQTIYADTKCVFLKNEFNTNFFVDLQSSVYLYEEQGEIFSNTRVPSDVARLAYSVYKNPNFVPLVKHLTINFNLTIIYALERASQEQLNHLHKMDRWEENDEIQDVIDSFYSLYPQFKKKVFKALPLDGGLMDSKVKKLQGKRYLNKFLE